MTCDIAWTTVHATLQPHKLSGIPAKHRCSPGALPGRVSIGSIYHRFESKEELLRAVHRQLMEDLREEQTAMIASACEAAHDLPSLLAILINETAEFLKRNAGALRPMMVCAGTTQSPRRERPRILICKICSWLR